RQIDRTILARMIFERDAKLLNLVQGDIGAAKERKTAEDTGQRSHQEQRGDDVAAQGFFVERRERGNEEQDKADQGEIKQVTPGLGGDEAQLGFDVMLLINFG